MTDKILIDRSVVEQALEDLEMTINYVQSPTRREDMRDSIDALRAALEQPDHSEQPLDMVPQVEQEPVAWQSRMRTKWMRDGEWWPWRDCSKEVADDYKRAPVVNDWEYGSRALYTHPQNLNCKSNQARLATLWGYEKKQPRQPLTDEVQSLIGSMVAELRAHRYCGDCYPENGWPGVNKVLADYAAFKRAHGIGGEK